LALTSFQRAVCRLLAADRIASGESYVAGGAAFNELTGAARVSRDIDLFHDTDQALERSWESDRHVLGQHGFAVRVVRERPAFVEAEVSREGATVLMEWARDSAYRFFPLVQHADLGLTLHPFDLATNKVLALVGRLEARDWIDVLEATERVQPLGYLAWAACGKDPGFGPLAILEQAGRSARYSAAEVLALSFEGDPPDPAALSRRWHVQLTLGRTLIDLLPAGESGRCVLGADGTLYRGDAAELGAAVGGHRLVFHQGRIRGAWPTIKP
jgi:hypothetical protein